MMKPFVVNKTIVEHGGVLSGPSREHKECLATPGQ